jgi:hypothetical protein
MENVAGMGASQAKTSVGSMKIRLLSSDKIRALLKKTRN